MPVRPGAVASRRRCRGSSPRRHRARRQRRRHRPSWTSPLFGADLAPGDEIVIVASSGLHAERLVAGAAGGGRAGRRLPHPASEPQDVRGGVARPDRDVRRARFRALFESSIEVHYLSHITGHGLLKLMRPRRELNSRSRSCQRCPRFSRSWSSRRRLAGRRLFDVNMGSDSPSTAPDRQCGRPDRLRAGTVGERGRRRRGGPAPGCARRDRSRLRERLNMISRPAAPPNGRDASFAAARLVLKQAHGAELWARIVACGVRGWGAGLSVAGRGVFWRRVDVSGVSLVSAGRVFGVADAEPVGRLCAARVGWV